MRINKEVALAIKRKKPVVALESTIISHGMPYPKNVETALQVEEEIRKNGAIPATIGIIEGEVVIGMSKEEIEQFGSRKGIVKVSKRDLPVVIGKKLWGATTVSGTMILASRAGIKFFVTGGIGGVHRGAESSFDVSRDLEELANEDVVVISAGAKAILDIPKTLEVLETKGVTILSYKNEHFANFYSIDTPYPVDGVFFTPEEAARIILSKDELKLSGGILISNPCPKESSLSHEEIDKYIEKAIEELDKEKISGKEATPFLLKLITELTKGDSLKTNISLVLNNARLGAQIAKCYWEERK